MDPRAAAARVQHAGQSQHGSEAAAAGRRAGRADRVRRRRIDRRQDSRASSGSTCKSTDLHSKYSLADLTFHESIPGHIWQGEYTHKMPLIRQLLAFNAYSEGWALYAQQLADELGAYDRRSGRPARLPAGDRLPRLPAGRRHRHPRQALDARAGREVLRRGERIESARSGERSRSLLLVARPGVRLQGRAQRDQPPAREGRRRRSARSST